MKHLKVLGVASLFWVAASVASAQDVLFKRNGDELQVKIIKVSTTEVEYKKWSNQDGPSYIIPKSDVFIIKYHNGDKDVFEEEVDGVSTKTAANQSEDESALGQPICASPAANNQVLIDGYNNDQHEFYLKDSGKPKKKKAKGVIGTLGVTASSILSTDDIEITLRQATEAESNRCWKDAEIGDRIEVSSMNAMWSHPIKYIIEITNKTARFIYIDKASCFRQSSTGETRLYFNPNKVSTIAGGSKGLGLNLGAVTDALGVGGVVGTLANGVNVGGGKENSTVIEHQDSRLISIPPKGKAVLSKDDYMDIEDGEDIVTGVSESFPFAYESGLQRNEYREYTEENTPLSRNYTIIYSYTQSFEKSYYVNFGVYIKDAIEAFKLTGIYLKHIDKYLKSRSPQTIVFHFFTPGY